MNHVFEAGAGESVEGMKDTWYIKRFTWTGHKLNVIVRNQSTGLSWRAPLGQTLADLDGDCDVDFHDFGWLAKDWQEGT